MPKPTAKPDPDRLISLKEVCDLAGGVNAMTVMRWVARGKFPQPIRAISSQRPKWRRKTIIEFFERLEREAIEPATSTNDGR